MTNSKRKGTWCPRGHRDSFRPSYHQRDDRYRHPPPRRHDRSTAAPPTFKGDLRRAVRHLLSLVSYSNITARARRDAEVDQIPLNDALADALDYMCYLTGSDVPRNSRGLLASYVYKELRLGVPETYLIKAGAEERRLIAPTWIPSPVVMARAAAAWMVKLEERRDRLRKQQVQNFFDKIELWIERWERGEVEWASMKNCLDLEG
jgi:hypothetical protein